MINVVSPNGSFKLMTVLNTVENEIQCVSKIDFLRKLKLVDGGRPDGTVQTQKTVGVYWEK